MFKEKKFNFCYVSAIQLPPLTHSLIHSPTFSIYLTQQHTILNNKNTYIKSFHKLQNNSFSTNTELQNNYSSFLL